MKQPLVLALNPAIDAEWRVDGVRWEEKNNVLDERRWAGGKGINVARWLKHLGAKPQLILPLGGSSGRELASLLRAEKIPATIIRLGKEPSPRPLERGPGEGNHATRVNVVITTKTQGQIRFNPLGPRLSKPEWQRLLGSVRTALPQASCLILSGSLPRGVPGDAYARLIRAARACQVPVLLDCDGPALVAAVRARPFLVKPNEYELLDWARSVGLRSGPAKVAFRRPGVRDEVWRAAMHLSQVTHGWVLVSCGAQPALLINTCANSEFTARPSRCRPRNTVGAGDALLAAAAQQVVHGAAPVAWLRHGLAAGSAATQIGGGQLP